MQLSIDKSPNCNWCSKCSIYSRLQRSKPQHAYIKYDMCFVLAYRLNPHPHRRVLLARLVKDCQASAIHVFPQPHPNYSNKSTVHIVSSLLLRSFIIITEQSDLRNFATYSNSSHLASTYIECHVGTTSCTQYCFRLRRIPL